MALVVRNLPANAGDIRDSGSIPGSGRSPGEGNGNPLQYSCLGNPRTEEPGGLQSTGLQRVGRDWSNLACTVSLMIQNVKNLPAMLETQVLPWASKIPWRREWISTPVFLPRDFHGQSSLVGYSPWGHKELDTTEWLTLSLFTHHGLLIFQFVKWHYILKSL